MSPPEDWTRGPAKWAAVLVLGTACISGLAWSVLTRAPRPAVAMSTPQPPPAPSPAPTAAPPADNPPQGPAPAARRININTATSSQLQLLPGIGPALAGRIIEHRASNGPFRSIDDLDNVKGIGPRTLEKLRPLITIE